MAFFLARVSGSSFQQPRRGRGHVGQLLRGRGQQIRRRDAHDGPVGLGEAGALERHLELRPDGRHHGSGAGRRRRGPHDPRRQPEEVVRELHPVLALVLVVYGRARQQDLMASMVKTCCPGRGRSRSSRVQAALRGRSSVTAKGTAQTAARPRRLQMRSDSSEVMVRIGLS